MVKSDRQDELGELAKSFNRMATQLSTSLVSCNRSTLSSPIGKPTSYNQTLEQQVEERTRELTQAIAQLQTAQEDYSIGKLAALVSLWRESPTKSTRRWEPIQASIGNSSWAR